ncbi:hypothetical protein G4B88_027738 [Cannabis sativa]|uniref:Uncharacterized protein n=1 Tax=Cannabis sativa TaxID=3483 RepID=A0A7J6EIQ6_CANSA|nr:hypothetical protein G4B88_027738 [Cannabis sativa]
MELVSFTVTFLVVLSLFSLYRTTFVVVGTIRKSDIMRDNNNTALLVSKEGMFGLGFFTPSASSSKNRYLGIWYNNITGNQTVVWVANRCEPIKDSSGLLSINNKGDLVLFSGQSNNRVLVWSSNSSKQAQEPLVQLLDNGNLVLGDEKDANTTIFLWESFDYPTDTMLPGMKLGWDLRRVSWESSNYEFVHNEDEIYFTYNVEIEYSLISRIFLSQAIDYTRWIEEEQEETCDNYGTCGANSKCIIVDDDPICQCLEGFEPKNKNNLSQGCVRNSFVSCDDKEKDMFYLTSELKVPQTRYTWATKSMKHDECNAKCLSNCSCTAYGYNSNLDGSKSELGIGTECVLWFGDLFDTRNSKEKINGSYHHKLERLII